MAGRRRSRFQRESRRRERAFEAAVYLIIIALLVVAGTTPLLSVSWVTLIGGAVLFGAALYQNAKHWRVNPLTWLAGAALMVIGYLELQTGTAAFGFLLPLMVLGFVLVVSFLTGQL